MIETPGAQGIRGENDDANASWQASAGAQGHAAERHAYAETRHSRVCRAHGWVAGQDGWRGILGAKRIGGLCHAEDGRSIAEDTEERGWDGHRQWSQTGRELHCCNHREQEKVADGDEKFLRENNESKRFGSVGLPVLETYTSPPLS